jgi:hypothetical protein
MLYGSEVWGPEHYKSKIEKDPNEIVQNKFCKMLLGVTKQATNNARRGELGSFPMKTISIFRSIKFWTTVETTENNDKLSYRPYKESIRAPEPVFWTENIRTILSSNGYGHIWLTGLEPQNQSRFSLSSIKQRLKDIEQQIWLSEIFNDRRRSKKNERNKLRTYRTFKTKTS